MIVTTMEFLNRLHEKDRIYLFNALFDFRILDHNFGISIRQFKGQCIDVSDLMFLVDTNHPYPNLKDSEKLILGVEAPKFEEFAEYQGEKLRFAPPDQLAYYGGFDSWGTYELGEKLYPELEKHFPFIVKMDRRFIPELAELEEIEQLIDKDNVDKASADLQTAIDTTKAELYENFGFFNPNSGNQVRALLTKLGYDTGVLTDGGKTGNRVMSVGIKALENLGDALIAKLLIRWAHLTKIQGSYFKPLKERLGFGLPVRIHYVNKRASTYRLSCGAYTNKEKGMKNKGHFISLNLQSAPKPSQILRRFDWDSELMKPVWKDDGSLCVETGDPKISFRKCFVVPDTHRLLSFDFNIVGETEIITKGGKK